MTKEPWKLFGRPLHLFGRPVNKERLFNMYWLFNARQARGSGLLNQFRFETYIPMVGVVYLLFPSIPKWTLGFVVPGFFLATYLLGLADEKKIGYWKFETHKNKTFKVNVYERRIERRLVNLEKALGTKHEPLPEEYKDD